MTKILFAVLLSIAFWCAPALRAENYPYRSDVLWVTVPDHADWVYRTGEKAKVEVQFYKYGIPRMAWWWNMSWEATLCLPTRQGPSR